MLSSTILVVDDEALVVRVVQATLQGSGYRIVTASDGEEALEVFEKHSAVINLVLTDVMMPRLNGWMLVDRLLTSTPDLPVLFMTGFQGDAASFDGLINNPKFDGYDILAKPFTTQQLLQKVEGTLKRARKKAADA